MAVPEIRNGVDPLPPELIHPVGMQDRSAGPQPEQLYCCQTAAGIVPQCCPVLCVVPAWITAGPCLPSYPTVWHAIIEDIEAQNQQWNHSSSFEKVPGMKHLCFRLQNLDHDSHSMFACIQFVQHMPMRPSHSDPPVMVCGVPQVLDTAGHHIPAASAKLSLRAQMSKGMPGAETFLWSRNLGNSSPNSVQ